MSKVAEISDDAIRASVERVIESYREWKRECCCKICGLEEVEFDQQFQYDLEGKPYCGGH